MKNYAGKTILITGASRGIGESAARGFAKAGANVVLCARGEAAIQAIAGDLNRAARAILCDVSKYTDVETAVNFAVSEFGGLDIFLGNAGAIEPISPLADSNPEDWGNVIDINLKGVYYGARAAIPVMLSAGGGTIINISSGAAHNPLEGWSQYCASKAGAAMITRSVDKEYGDKGIRCIGLSPGTVATQMQRDIKESGVNRVSRLDWDEHIPPEWVARCILWMCGPAGDDLCGTEVSLREENVRRAVGLIS